MIFFLLWWEELTCKICPEVLDTPCIAMGVCVCVCVCIYIYIYPLLFAFPLAVSICVLHAKIKISLKSYIFLYSRSLLPDCTASQLTVHLSSVRKSRENNFVLRLPLFDPGAKKTEGIVLCKFDRATLDSVVAAITTKFNNRRHWTQWLQQLPQNSSSSHSAFYPPSLFIYSAWSSN